MYFQNFLILWKHAYKHDFQNTRGEFWLEAYGSKPFPEHKFFDSSLLDFVLLLRRFLLGFLLRNKQK